jgi:hypothetical protein
VEFKEAWKRKRNLRKEEKGRVRKNEEGRIKQNRIEYTLFILLE